MPNAAMAPSLYPAYRARVEEVISRLDPEGDLSSRQLLASDTELDPNFCRCGFDPPIGPDRSNVDTSGGNDTLQLFGCASALFVALMLMWMSVFAMCGSPFAIR